ncbi:MAG: NeuD/PglB/VioB family sugar acetyltransferase [Candidatus Falkowbacteria bacterium]
MPKKVILIGAGENAQVIRNILDKQKQYNVIGYLDDTKKGKEIIGKIVDFEKYVNDTYFFITICNNKVRKKLYNLFKKNNAKFINTLHGKAYLEEGVKIGENVFIGAFSYVNVNSKIGDNSFINNCCIIEHDNLIKEHSHLAPGVITGGKVKIGANSFVGLGAIINDHIIIDNNVIIGSGAVVIDNIKNNSTAVGVPAKIIK